MDGSPSVSSSSGRQDRRKGKKNILFNRASRVGTNSHNPKVLGRGIRHVLGTVLLTVFAADLCLNQCRGTF